MKLFIPDLTTGGFSAARLHAKKYDIGSKLGQQQKLFNGLMIIKLLTSLILLFHLMCVQIYRLVKKC
jgi:hypothetical protein